MAALGTIHGLTGPDPNSFFRLGEKLSDGIDAGAPLGNAGGLAAMLPVSRQAVAQHLAVLEEARLVTRRRSGRQVLFTVRPEGLIATAGWLAARAAAWEIQKFFADRNRKKKIVQRIVFEYIRKKTAYHHIESVILNRPGSMFPG